ncbi:MAG: hypothetical protein OEZ43_11620 [Gammaproteobacteria bacterium]|nr:hypothetical protein [Gammaproteobacteria bacterium]
MKNNSLVIFAFIWLLSACSDHIPPPPLSGPWKAGSTTFEISDSSRWLQVRAWYPSEQETENKLLSSDEHSNSAFADSIDMPRFLMGGEDVSRSSFDVEIAAGKFPVLIFNHGLMSFARQNVTHFEQLASHGYIVLSVANPGVSMVVVRTNGEVIVADKNSPAYLALEKQKNGAKELAPALVKDIESAKAAKDFTSFSESMAVLAKNPVFEPMTAVFESVYANNVLLFSTLKKIQNGTLATPIAGHLDLDNIGAFGHSFGSIMSGVLAMGDFGVKAAFGMDAPQLNLAIIPYRQFDVPVCYVYADNVKFADEILDTGFINKPLLKTNNSCEAVFKQSAHYNFTDLNLVTPLRFSPMLGKIDNALMANNIEKLLLGFFDQHLKKKTSLSSLQLDSVDLRIY